MDEKDQELHCLLAAIILAGSMAGDRIGKLENEHVKSAVKAAAMVYEQVETYHLTKKKEN